VTLVSEYDPAWPSWFLQIRELVAEKLGSYCLGIEHVGSTAVPGMTAKPIIDIVAVIECGMFQIVQALLDELGYRHQGDLGIQGREAFKLEDPGMSVRLPPHHLYVCPRESEELKRQVAFRDYLLVHPEWVLRLSELKRSLCEQHSADREAYAEGKSAMVQEITCLALRCLDCRNREDATGDRGMSQSTKGFDEINAEARRIWDANAEWWDDRKGEGSPLEDDVLIPVTERLLGLQSGEAVLDIGCGAGRFARRMAEAGAHVVACDFSERFIQRARKRTPSSLTNVEYHVVDATSESALLALGSACFDAAVATMVLMDMTAVDPLMRALSKLLKPRGRFVFTVMHPCFNSPYAFKVAEEVHEEGRLVFQTSMKIIGYLTAITTRGEAILGQPEPQLYFHRPIGQLLKAGFEQGFVVDGLEEPAEGRTGDSRSFRFSWNDVPEIPPVLAVRMRLHNR